MNSLAHHFRYMAFYNKNCTERLISTFCKGSPRNNEAIEAVYNKSIKLFFNSMHGTMNHILGADQLWYARITGSAMPQDISSIYALDGDALGKAWEDRLGKDDLFSRLQVQCDKWITLLEDKDDKWCLEEVTYKDTEGNDIIIVRAAGLTQVFNHGTHHRGQISTGFANFGIDCPSFDHQELGDYFLKYGVIPS